MAILVVPPIETGAARWPTLGPQVCDWIEERLVYGPGPLKGEPYVIEPEFRAEIHRAYEVYPHGHPRAGRRRFKRVVLSKRKGTAKTEKAAILMIAEAHPEAPVRADGFRREGRLWVPVGRGVASPYIPMLAYTEEQSEDLAYGVLRVILEHSSIADDFDVGLERVVVLDDRGRASGKIQALAGSPSARDGAITTAQHFDETHRYTTPRLINAATTMRQNIFKRVDADAWSLETTTAGDGGEESVARSTHEYAEMVAAGKVEDSSLFYAHRFAPDRPPKPERRGKVPPEFETVAEVLEALREASGPAAEWSADLDALAASYFDPDTDRHYFERVWLNRWDRKGRRRAFDPAAWARCAKPDYVIADGALVGLGFDGARRSDATALVATELATGHQEPLLIIERPFDAVDDWEVSASDVDLAVEAAFERFDVWRMYADPPFWDEWVTHWEATYGDERVVKWWTNQTRKMAHALRAYRDAMSETGRPLTHGAGGDDELARLFAAHIANAVRKDIPMRDDRGLPLWVIEKERHDSPKKIDASMAGTLSWAVRCDAVALGVLTKKKRSRVFGSG